MAETLHAVSLIIGKQHYSGAAVAELLVELRGP